MKDTSEKKNELEMLIQQKKEIEAKIKELRGSSISFGRAKISIEHYPTIKPDRHFLAIRYAPIDGREKYQTLFSANDRKSVIEAIPGIINDLKGLYDTVKEETK